MKKDFFKLGFATIAFCFSISSNAAINEIGTLNWDTSSQYITVDGSSTRYMNLGFTEGKTYEQTLTELGSNPLLNGFSIANTADAFNFYNAMATTDAVNIDNLNQTFYEGVSFTDNELGSTNNQQFNQFYFLEGQYQAGWIQFRDDIPNQNYREILLYESPDTSMTFGNTFGFMGPQPRGPVNILLVSDTVSSVAAVPEPETYGMMLLGLGLLGFASRRKQA